MLKLAASNTESSRLPWRARLRGIGLRLLTAFFEAFPMRAPDPSTPSPPLAMTGALRESALLAERTDAQSRKSVA